MSNFLPSKLIKALQKEFHIDTDAFEEMHRSGNQITSIRINPDKPQIATEGLEQVPWCQQGYYLPQRPSFTRDPLFHAGTYYVQEASSMFVAHIIQSLHLNEQPVIALDLCAAPGGKSTLLNSNLHRDSLLVSNEIIKTRVNVLADNLTKWGNANVVVTNNDPSAFSRLPGYFDIILVDAPCSGSGMFRKDEDAVTAWSEEVVKLCSQRQQRILADSLSSLKTGGFLLYSTCSYSIEENEQIADWLCKTYGLRSVQVPINAEWGIEETCSPERKAFGYRFYPHKLKGEGLFISCFVKDQEQSGFSRRKIKPERYSFSAELLAQWVEPEFEPYFFPFKEDIILFPKQHEPELKILQDVLYLRKSGTKMGKLNRKELIPHHELALSNSLASIVPCLDLNFEQALHYLRKGDLTVESDLAGWVLATYRHVGLGWMKLLPNRINNYYPKEWRIMNL